MDSVNLVLMFPPILLVFYLALYGGALLAIAGAVWLVRRLAKRKAG